MTNPELETVTKQTLRAMTESPAAAVVSVLWLLLFLWYFYFEMMTLTLACERAWRRESSSFLKLLGKAFLRSVRLFRWANLPLILGLTAALPVLMAPFTGNMGIAGQIVTSFLSLAQEHSWVWGLFVLLILRGFWIALHAKDRFGTLMVVGIMTLISLQTFLNIAVVTGLIPATGISLPFFSYGGTALALQLTEIGIVLSVSRQIPAPRAG